MGFCGRDFVQFEATEKSRKIEQPAMPPEHPAKLRDSEMVFGERKLVIIAARIRAANPILARLATKGSQPSL